MENKYWWWIGGAVAVAVALFFIFSGGDDDADTTTTTIAEAVDTTEAPTETTEAPTETTAPDETTTTEGDMVDAVKACQVTDTGGIDDQTFNATSWKGIEDAIAAGIATDDSKFVESQSATDYAPNIQAMIDDGCDLVITVGFLLGDDTKAAAEANPDQPFQIIDFLYDPVIPNVEGAIFGTTDAAFLAGYMSAAVSETGIVATYGGIQIPCGVTCFMDGFVFGVRHWNEVNGGDVQVLGWNPEDQTGVFTGDFENLDNGRNVAKSFVDEGADVIFPVAGPVGLGSAAFAQENEGVWVLGVDADWFITAPEFADVTLTSVLKGLDVAVYTAIEAVANGTFEGGTALYAIADDGVGLGGVNETVDAAIVAEVEQLTEDVKSGDVVPGDYLGG